MEQRLKQNLRLHQQYPNEAIIKSPTIDRCFHASKFVHEIVSRRYGFSLQIPSLFGQAIVPAHIQATFLNNFPEEGFKFKRS